MGQRQRGRNAFWIAALAVPTAGAAVACIRHADSPARYYLGT